MLHRAPTLLLISSAVSGCASLQGFAAGETGSAPSALVAKWTAAEAYATGVDFLQRGDYDAARRAWDRCLAMARPDSPERLDCMVARERLAYPADGEP
ncbi:MAG: hypothetical protein HY079_14300 [Elusimicrobia bacterium]|nr:hypothetical protein [Elusimicrobiota bacterium]